MGSYLYEQTSKQFNVIHPEHGVITVNVFQYYCKPYWDLWNGLTPYGEQEKKIAAGYNRKRAVAEKRTPNQYVARAEDDGTYLVYHWDTPRPPIIFCDDENFGIHLKQIGRMVKHGRSWYLGELKGGQP